MGMHPQLGGLKERDKKRLHFIKEIGCVACHIRFGAASPGGVGHHAEDDNDVVLGHDCMICFCDWHHVAARTHGKTRIQMLDEYGPSRHFHTVAFREEFGTDLQLLEKQNALLEGFLKSFVIPPY